MVNYLEPDHFSVETALDHRLSGMAIAGRQHPQREKASGVSSRVVDSNQPSNYAFMDKSNEEIQSIMLRPVLLRGGVLW